MSCSIISFAPRAAWFGSPVVSLRYIPSKSMVGSCVYVMTLDPAVRGWAVGSTPHPQDSENDFSTTRHALPSYVLSSHQSWPLPHPWTKQGKMNVFCGALGGAGRFRVCFQRRYRLCILYALLICMPSAGKINTSRNFV